MTFVGWFLLVASRESYAQVAVTEGLRDRVAEVMSRDYPTVDNHSNLKTSLKNIWCALDGAVFVVTFNGHAEGTPKEVSGVERQRWPFTTVAEVMRPLDQIRTVAPDALVTRVSGSNGTRGSKSVAGPALMPTHC